MAQCADTPPRAALSLPHQYWPSAGASPWTPGAAQKGDTALHLAIMRQRERHDIVTALVDAGANANATDKARRPQKSQLGPALQYAS